ncbi:preprotein translocase subunit YajC [Novacetimonas pomaceti]|uniref:Preprotein translocase subunit YajC n=1 Tax=Novacetimonas pomaceti TaxID=2021998 RepID=A0A318QQJ9_9PROT|nr:preprotein translocase subunit YajC [Novacetimonas pomaceti]PYD75013.1 preprotein translocase subunit YajC [Novacetimonas pomaceti]
MKIKTPAALRFVPSVFVPGLAALSLGAMTMAMTVGAPHAARADTSVIMGNQVSSATVETVDHEAGTVLLRDHTGDLVTVRIPPEARNVPRLQAGDKINIRFFKTMDATIVPPGTQPPVSTVTSAKGYAGLHPHGMLVSNRRERVHVLAVDPAHNIITFDDPDEITRTEVIHDKAMQPLLGTVKVGDYVDVTVTDAVSFEVTNRVIAPSATVQQAPGQKGDVQKGDAPPASAPSAP